MICVNFALHQVKSNGSNTIADTQLNLRGAFGATSSEHNFGIYINDNPIKDDQKIYFMPNGLQTPISFLLSDGNYEMWVDGDINGNFILSN